MKASTAPLLVFLVTLSACNCGGPRLVEAHCLQEEVCGNGEDDTCDGVVDEGCPCEVGDTRACGGDVGGCLPGTQTCEAAGVWSVACDGEVPPQDESCDGVDNDCDGAVDEGDACAAPVVSCPGARSAAVGQLTVLLGTANAGSGAPIASVGWHMAARPEGGSAELDPQHETVTTLAPDVAGLWRLSFCATNEAGATTCCQTEVDAYVACALPPAPPVSTACETSWDGRPTVQFAPVAQGLVYELMQDGEVLAAATSGHNHLRPPARIDPGSAPPGTQVELAVRACREDDSRCCSAGSTAQVRIIEACDVPVPASASNLILSEYVVNGEGACSTTSCDCQNGEAIELTNLTNCPVSLDGFHFAYRNDNGSPASYRWMNFGATDIVPPRGVYVAMRNRHLATNCAASLGAPHAGLYGLSISALEMQGEFLCSGWFKNAGGGQSELRVAPGAVASGAGLDFSPASALTRVAPYQSASGVCVSTGFDAIDSCGNVVSGQTPSDTLSPNQLGRLWHPCDAVVAPSPSCVRD